LSVAKRRRIKIAVRGETFFWQITPHIPYDDYPYLTVLSGDKRLNFVYPLSPTEHSRFLSRMEAMGLRPPTPGTETVPNDDNAKYWERGLVSAFEITPGFVRALIEWCLDNNCLTVP